MHLLRNAGTLLLYLRSLLRNAGLLLLCLRSLLRNTGLVLLGSGLVDLHLDSLSPWIDSLYCPWPQ
jgi:hypothetical protein